MRSRRKLGLLCPSWLGKTRRKYKNGLAKLAKRVRGIEKNSLVRKVTGRNANANANSNDHNNTIIMNNYYNN